MKKNDDSRRFWVMFAIVCISVLVVLIGIHTIADTQTGAQQLYNDCMCCCKTGDCYCSDTLYDFHKNKCIIGPAGIQIETEPINNISDCAWQTI